MVVGNLETRLAVNPFREEVKVEKMPESVTEVEVTIDEAVEKAIQQYLAIEYREQPKDGFRLEEEIIKGELIDAMQVETLMPSQIDLVQQRLLDYQNHRKSNRFIPEEMKHANLPNYIINLLKKSYGAGNNNFILTVLDSVMHYPTEKIHGTKDNLIKITLNGNTKDSFGKSSTYCDYIITGNVLDDCGEESQNCRYVINGNAGRDLAKNAKNCEFIVHGDIIQIGGWPEKCVFTFNKIIGVNPYAVDCVYKTRDPDSYKILEKEIGKMNTLILLDVKNNIIEQKNSI